jgi:preprotein translocase subunit YajC
MDLNITHYINTVTDTLLNVIISSAHAEEVSRASQSAGIIDFVPLLLIFVVFYFMLIRPQMKRTKEHKALVEALSKGDEVMTNGGLVGRVADLGENFILVEIAAGTEVKIQRQSITTILPKGTIKTL